MKNPFGSVITAMITPFKRDGELNSKEAIKIANYLVDHDTDTVVLAGTTGESPTLTHDEEAELFECVSKGIKGRGRVIAGTGSNCTKTAIHMSKIAEEIGVDGLLQVVPYYNKPSQEGIYQHFKAVAESVRIGIMLYNIPGRTGRNMTPETVARLAQIDNILAIKEASEDIAQVEKIKRLVPEDFLIFSGDDGLTLPILDKGGVGVVSVASHCVGPQIKEMIRLFKKEGKENKEKAEAINKQLMPVYQALFTTTNPVPVKYAMGLMGFEVGEVRLPLVPLTEEEKVVIQKGLNTLKVLDNRSVV